MATKEIFPLFKLPRELRDTIYEYVILGEDPNDLLKAACLNKNLYGEVLDVYYRKIPFFIWHGNCWEIQESVSIKTISSIRNAKIDLNGWNLTASHFEALFKPVFVGTESKFMQAASLCTLTVQATETRYPTPFIKELISIALNSFPNLSTVVISFPIFDDYDDFLDWVEDFEIEEPDYLAVTDVDTYLFKAEMAIFSENFIEGKLPESGVMREVRKILGKESHFEERMKVDPDWESKLVPNNYWEEVPDDPVFEGWAVWQAERGRTLKENRPTKKLTDSQAMQVCELISEDWPELEDSDREWWSSW